MIGATSFPEVIMRVLTAVAVGICVAFPRISAAQAAPSNAPIPDPGWGKVGGVVGIVGALGVLGLATVAEVINDRGDNATAIGGAALGLSIPAVAIAAIGDASVRGVPRNSGLPIVGWISYALAAIDGATLVGLGVADVQVPPGPIIACGVLGALGIGLISFDAIRSASAAESARARMRSGAALQVSPTINAVRTANGRLAPGLGINLRF